MKVPTIYKAYFLGLCKGISQQNIQYLHFRILEFPLNRGKIYWNRGLTSPILEFQDFFPEKKNIWETSGSIFCANEPSSGHCSKLHLGSCSRFGKRSLSATTQEGSRCLQQKCIKIYQNKEIYQNKAQDA